MATTTYFTKKTYGEKLLDPRWQKKRLEVLETNNFTCQYCGDTETTLHVHHLCYKINGNPWDTDLSALLCLCEECHKISHIINLTPLEKLLIDELQILALMYNGSNATVNYMVKVANRSILKYKG